MYVSMCICTSMQIALPSLDLYCSLHAECGTTGIKHKYFKTLTFSENGMSYSN